MVSVLADAALKTKPPPRVGVGKMVAPRANTTRMEDFEVQRKLGQGSFGVVYAVTRKRDLAKRRTFVIKQVELGPRRSEQEAAIDECRVLSKMDSKYVVKYFESFITKGSKLCIVMEYAPKVRFRRVRRDETHDRREPRKHEEPLFSRWRFSFSFSSSARDPVRRARASRLRPLLSSKRRRRPAHRTTLFRARDSLFTLATCVFLRYLSSPIVRSFASLYDYR